MNTIWKTVLKAIDIQDIEAPEGAEFLTAREQDDQLCVWFRCDPDKPMKKRHIRICRTGHKISEGGDYIGTGFLHSGRLVFHVFEIG